MRRALLLAVAALAGSLRPAVAQKVPPASTRQSSPTAASAPPAAKVLRPAAAPAVPAPVTPQSAQPPAPAPAHSAGLAAPPYTGDTPEAAVAYTGQFVHLLDSTIVALVATFRNTSGQPVLGARGPETLSQRERDRWTRCRDLYWDLTTYASAAASLGQALPAGPDVQLAAARLDSAFSESTATAECDNIASMIAAPDRFVPWQGSYETAARHFYQDFYVQVRRIHEAARALVFALNGSGAARQPIAMPPGLPPNPPFAGAGPT